VAARVAVPLDEVTESVRLVQQILRELPAGPHEGPFQYPMKVLWASE